MEEKPFFAPSGPGKEPQGDKAQEKPEISFSPGRSDKKPKKGRASKTLSDTSALKNLSIKKVLFALLIVVVLFLLLQNTICAGGSDPGRGADSSGGGAVDSSANDTTADTASDPDTSNLETTGSADSEVTPLPGNSAPQKYSGDAVILVGQTEITAEEVSEREALIASYLDINNITNLSAEEKREAAISQLLEVSWAKEAARGAGIQISARAISNSSRGKSKVLVKKLRDAGYSAAQIEDLIRLELTRRALEKRAMQKAKKVTVAKARKAYKKAKIKKPFKKVKKKLQKKIRKKQVAAAKKSFQRDYDDLWKSRTSCAPDYKIANYCGRTLSS